MGMKLSADFHDRKKDAVVELSPCYLAFQRTDDGEASIVIQLDIMHPEKSVPINVMRSDSAHIDYFTTCFRTADESFGIPVSRP